MYTSLTEVQHQCQDCTACDLSHSRTQVVFSAGNPHASCMIIGEAPGQQEDESGEPFVGRSGQLLMQFLADVGIHRERDVYICNTVKCRPPQNRKPTLAEKEACRSFLEAQIRWVRPKLIVLCGATAVQSLLPDEKRSITQIRGQWFERTLFEEAVKIMPVFHPSYLLRHHSLEAGKPRALMRQDLLEIKRQLASYS